MKCVTKTQVENPFIVIVTTILCMTTAAWKPLLVTFIRGCPALPDCIPGSKYCYLFPSTRKRPTPSSRPVCACLFCFPGGLPLVVRVMVKIAILRTALHAVLIMVSLVLSLVWIDFWYGRLWNILLMIISFLFFLLFHYWTCFLWTINAWRLSVFGDCVFRTAQLSRNSPSILTWLFSGEIFLPFCRVIFKLSEGRQLTFTKSSF